MFRCRRELDSLCLIHLVVLLVLVENSQCQKAGNGSCVHDLNLAENGGCCVESRCCVAEGCCCDQLCYDFEDCCLDVWLISCPPLENQKPINASLYTCSKAYYGSNDGCCVSDCRMREQMCYCDQDCYHYNDCCSDIKEIGCQCNFTCADHFDNSSGCCTGSNCDTSCCSCDENCYDRGDCCMDIEEWGCVVKTVTTMPTSTPTIIPMNYCPNETVHDNGEYSIIWTPAPPGSISYEPCPPPRNGSVSRFCSNDSIWEDPVTSNCLLQELVEFELENLTSLPPDEQVEHVASIMDTLSNVSGSPVTHLYPVDVQSIIKIIPELIDILRDNIGSRNLTKIFLETSCLDVFSNLLDKRYIKAFKEIGTSEGGSKDLVIGYDEYENYAAMFQAEYGSIEQSIRIVKDNLVFSVSVDSERKAADLIFPIEDDLSNFSTKDDSYAEVIYSLSDLKTLTSNGERVATVNSLVKNIANILPDQFMNSNTTTGSIVLTSQVVSGGQSARLPVLLNFTSRSFENKDLKRGTCAFWNSSENNGYGEWSTDGIDVIYNSSINSNDSCNCNQLVVTCRVDHQTPFVVLVDVQDIEYNNPQEEYALEIVGLIGISVSIVSLILTIIFLMFLGKQVVKGTHYFIHFNLSIALLGGYITFLLFIDERIIDLTHTKVGCSIVAVFLQFFFTAAFSWMMCEGIMLFLLLVMVFSSLSKRWYVFLIIGWGIPIIPVVISASLIHDHYGSPGRHCWISTENSETAIWAFVIPMLLIIIVNIFFLILSVRALILYHRRRHERETNMEYKVFKKTIVGTLTLLPLLGITWVIGLFAVDKNTTVFAWLFVILNSLQGLFIFAFNIARNDKIQEKIAQRCCPKRTKEKKMRKSTSGRLATNSSSFKSQEPFAQQFLMKTTNPSVSHDDGRPDIEYAGEVNSD